MHQTLFDKFLKCHDINGKKHERFQRTRHLLQNSYQRFEDSYTKAQYVQAI